jgi:hypothetical protein
LFFNLPWVTGLINVAFAGSLLWSLSQAEQVMHPPSPITSSGSATIQIYFFLLTLLCLLLGWLISRFLSNLQSEG